MPRNSEVTHTGRPLSRRPLPFAGELLRRPSQTPMKSASSAPVARQRSGEPLPWSSDPRDLLGSEATAGIEPAMKVLQTFDLLIGLTLRLSSRRAKGAPQ